jgi:serine/threonine-protein kinase
MELVEGRPLSDIIREKGPLDYRFVLKISEQIASALSVAHKNNIIHRDVKPHNILITQDGHAKITDFGIARAVTDGTTVNDNTVKGTVHYFSPEQGRGMYMDERSDIYSLGIVMFEMLTGEVPFDADNAVAIAVMHMNDRLPQPSRLVPGVPPALEQIILKATEKHQVNRFKNADEMLEALRNVDRLTGGFVDPVIAGAVKSSITDESDVYAGENGRERDPQGAYGEEDYGADEYAADDDGYDARPEPYVAGAYYDEDDEDDLRARKAKAGAKPKRKDENRKYKALAIIAAVVLAALIVYFVVSPLITKFMGAAPEALKVEDLTGKSVEDAEEVLKEQGYLMEIGDGVPSPDIKEGYVALQEPEPGTELEEGKTVVVHLSTGPEETPVDDGGDEPDPEEPTTEKVPDLIGKSRASAEYAIEAAGFVVGEVTPEDSEKPIDQVIAQSPKAGKDLEKGSEIDFTISQGSKAKEVKAPDLMGMPLKKATSALEKVGLVIGSADPEYSDVYEKDTVMWQQYKKNTKLSEGQTVDVKISKGPEDKESTVTIDIDFTDAPADTFTLDVVLYLADGKEQSIVEGEQCFKASGSTQVSVTGKGAGAKVEVYFDAALVKSYDVDFNKGTVSG